MTHPVEVFLSDSRHEREAAAGRGGQLERAGLSEFMDDQSNREGDQRLDKVLAAVDGHGAFVAPVGEALIETEGMADLMPKLMCAVTDQATIAAGRTFLCVIAPLRHRPAASSPRCVIAPLRHRQVNANSTFDQLQGDNGQA